MTVTPFQCQWSNIAEWTDAQTLFRLCCVSKELKAIASQGRLWKALFPTSFPEEGYKQYLDAHHASSFKAVAEKIKTFFESLPIRHIGIVRVHFPFNTYLSFDNKLIRCHFDAKLDSHIHAEVLLALGCIHLLNKALLVKEELAKRGAFTLVFPQIVEHIIVVKKLEQQGTLGVSHRPTEGDDGSPIRKFRHPAFSGLDQNARIFHQFRWCQGILPMSGCHRGDAAEQFYISIEKIMKAQEKRLILQEASSWLQLSNLA